MRFLAVLILSVAIVSVAMVAVASRAEPPPLHPLHPPPESTVAAMLPGCLELVRTSVIQAR